MLPQGGLNGVGCRSVGSSSTKATSLMSPSASSSSSSLSLHSSSIPATMSSSASIPSVSASGPISSQPSSSFLSGGKIQQRMPIGEMSVGGTGHTVGGGGAGASTGTGAAAATGLATAGAAAAAEAGEAGGESGGGVQGQVLNSEEAAAQQSVSEGGSEAQGSESSAQKEKEKVYQCLNDMLCTSKREISLAKLSKYRESFPDLAPLMWHSFGCITVLLQEIISIYPMLSPPNLSNQASNKTCNCLALLQCIASHPETRSHFLAAHIPLYLYPFLNTVTKSRQFEYLRLTSLGVIGALVKVDDPEVVSFLLQTEIIPLCLRVMETGSELSKTVATFIIQKILLDELGLTYICATPERFFTVCQVLGNVITQHNEAPSPRLLKHIIRCYLRLSENSKVRDALKQTIPSIILSPNFKVIFHDDAITTKWLHQLYTNIC